ncbi:4362_t:CDS:1 [Scutellospora calospora]|uniref:4362_t:CDS:1 n=1 Tax=Scutellospora calospora TaxID=85575 RepID=A0ACA9JXY3_9GLOM|nr:4362_t:CDS:1 [Scutellospora calospora]
MSVKQKEINDAITLHRTKIHENRIEALKVFQKYKVSYWLAIYYEKGYGGLEIDENKALKYYRISTLKGVSNSALKEALLLLKTHKENESDEFNLLITTLIKKSANYQNIDACYYYGDILLHGKYGNEVDSYIAFKYLEYAANNGNDKAKELIDYREIYNEINNDYTIIYFPK